jgi:hypothetical protein
VGVVGLAVGPMPLTRMRGGEGFHREWAVVLEEWEHEWLVKRGMVSKGRFVEWVQGVGEDNALRNLARWRDEELVKWLLGGLSDHRREQCRRCDC